MVKLFPVPPRRTAAESIADLRNAFTAVSQRLGAGDRSPFTAWISDADRLHHSGELIATTTLGLAHLQEASRMAQLLASFAQVAGGGHLAERLRADAEVSHWLAQTLTLNEQRAFRTTTALAAAHLAILPVLVLCMPSANSTADGMEGSRHG